MFNFISKEILPKIKNRTARFIVSLFIIFIGLYLTFYTTTNLVGLLPNSGESNNISVLPEDKIATEKIIEERYTGCDIKGSSGKYISSSIEIHAPTGFSIINYKEVPKEGNETIIESRSNLSDPTFKDGKKFTATCVGNGKVKRVLGIVVDHDNSWRMSDIILTLKKNEK